MPDPTTSLSSWQRATKHVQTDVRSGDYVSAETSLVFAGPPRLSDLGGVDDAGAIVSSGDAFYPIGMVDSIQWTQSQDTATLFEIGSRRSNVFSGRVRVQGSIGRVQFNGPSLLRALYAYYPNDVKMANDKNLDRSIDSVASSTNSLIDESKRALFPPILFEAGTSTAPRPGTDKSATFFINLMSELFSHPFGLGVIIRDNRDQNYGALYIEDCLINTHSQAVNASSTLITEAVNFTATTVLPLEFATN